MQNGKCVFFNEGMEDEQVSGDDCSSDQEDEDEEEEGEIDPALVLGHHLDVEEEDY